MITIPKDTLNQLLGLLPVFKYSSVFSAIDTSCIGWFIDNLPKVANESYVLVSDTECGAYVAPTNAEGWIQNCICGRRFMTQQRTGQCPDCGMGYEILKNRGELSI